MTSPHPGPASSLDRIVAALEAEATLVDEGQFTVDWQRAVQLMGSYALAGSIEWLAVVLQAGGLMGAQAIDVACGGDEVEIFFENLHLLHEELSDPLGSLGRKSQDRRASGLYKLATVHATLLTRTKFVEIQTHRAGEGGHRATYTDSEKCVEPIDVPSDAPVGTTLRAVFRGAPDGGRLLEVTRMLEERCKFSNVATRLGGRRVDQGWNAILDGIAKSVAILDPIGTIVGLAGFRISDTPDAEVLVQIGGVLIERVQLPDLEPGFIATVDLDLHVDLSLSKLVRNHDFEEMLRWVRDAHSRAPRPSAEDRAKLENERAQAREDEEAREEAETQERVDSRISMVFGVLALALVPLVVYVLEVFFPD